MDSHILKDTLYQNSTNYHSAFVDINIVFMYDLFWCRTQLVQLATYSLYCLNYPDRDEVRGLIITVLYHLTNIMI
jgi:hypothetical protein